MSDTKAHATAGATARRRRTAVNRQKDRVGTLTQLRGMLDQPVLWEQAAMLPPQSHEGRRRKLPSIFYLAMPSMAAIWRSFSRAETELSEPETWEHLCRLIHDLQPVYSPAEPAFDLPALLRTKPLTAQNFFDARTSWLAPHLDLLEHLFEEGAVDAAEEVGHGDPDGPGSANSLVRTRVAAGDGKVTREPGSRYRPLRQSEVNKALKITPETHVVDKETGEIVASGDMAGDAHLYITGSGPVVGYKTIRLAIRSDDTLSTIIMCVKRPQTKDEAATAVEAAIQLKKRLPGLLALVYDGALKGTHIRELARRAGLVTVAPVSAKSRGKSRDKSDRVEKQGDAGSFIHPRPDGLPCRHDFQHVGGQLHTVTTDSHGKNVSTPCSDPTVRIRANKASYRMYLEWDVYCAAGMPPGTTPTKQGTFLHTITEDNNPDLSVAENLSVLPPASPRYTDPHGWRQTIENDNHQSDGSKFLRRGRSSRPDWNHQNEIGWAIVQNGVAIQRVRQRQAVAAEAPPAAA